MAHLSIYRTAVLEGVFYLPEHQVVIGRADGVEIQLLDGKVSRRHAVIRKSVAGFMIQDLDTKNGTFVNKERVERSLLFHGDRVVIGAYTLRFAEGDLEELDSGFVSTASATAGGLRVNPVGDGASAKARTVPDGGAPMDREEAQRSRIPATPVMTGDPESLEIEGLAPADSGEVPLRSLTGTGASIEVSLDGIGRGGLPMGGPTGRGAPAQRSLVPAAPWTPGPVAAVAAPKAPEGPSAVRRVPDPRTKR